MGGVEGITRMAWVVHAEACSSDREWQKSVALVPRPVHLIFSGAACKHHVQHSDVWRPFLFVR